MKKVRTFLWFDDNAEEAAKCVMQAMLKMGKVDMKGLQAAYDGK
jgi:predicted 3-demethylubiquinone-9 3-methyltransferase (glyoxalase superfamily)